MKACDRIRSKSIERRSYSIQSNIRIADHLDRVLVRKERACMTASDSGNAGGQAGDFAVDQRRDRILRFYDHAGDEPTLLFLHGLGGNSKVWIPFVRDDGCRAFSTNGRRRRAIRVDLLGHGDSSKPGNFDYSMTAQANAIRQLLDELQVTRIIPIGASYGGGVAAELAREVTLHPAHQQIEGLVLIAGAALYFPPPSRIRYARNPFLRWWLENCGTARLVARILLEGSFYKTERVPPQLIEDIAAPLRMPGARRAIRLAALEMFDELAARQSDTARFSCLRCPTLLVWGEHDGTVPRDVMTRLGTTIPNARCTVVPDCGHTPHEECPHQLEEILRNFFAQLGTR